MPYVAWGQHLEYLWKMVAMQVWEQAYKAHRTNDVTGAFFTLKPVDELYDMVADPDNVVNLAGRPEHQQRLVTMQAQLREWQLAIHDSALLPEAERERRSSENKTTIYQMVRDPKLYDLPAYLDSADLALARNPANTPRLLEYLKNSDSAIRYWGTVGLLMLGKADAGTQTALEAVLNDPCGEVSAMAAWVLIQSGNPGKARQTLTGLLQRHAPATLMALNVLDWSQADLTPYLPAITSLPTEGGAMTGYEQRMVDYLLQSHGLPLPAGTGKASQRQLKKDAVKDL